MSQHPAKQPRRARWPNQTTSTAVQFAGAVARSARQTSRLALHVSNSGPLCLPAEICGQCWAWHQTIALRRPGLTKPQPPSIRTVQLPQPQLSSSSTFSFLCHQMSHTDATPLTRPAAGGRLTGHKTWRALRRFRFCHNFLTVFF